MSETALPDLSGHLETKDFSLELKLEELTEDGQFEGYASVFNNVDAHGDIIEPGAFKKTIREQKGQVPILWQHDPYEPIGISLELEEDDHGLRTRGQLVLDTQRGAEAYALLKRQALRGLSIGYSAIKYLIEREDPDVRRRLKELRLWEYSPVTFPANRLAVVGTVKSAEIARLARVLRDLRETDPETVKALLESIEADASPDQDPADRPPSAEPAETTLARQFIDFTKGLTD